MSLPFKEWEDLSKLTGNILRPGGLDITTDALAHCNFKAGHYLLDLGCGLGGTAIHLSSLGYDVLGLDLSRQLLKKAHAAIYADKTLHTATIKEPALIQGDINSLPLKDACIHGIFCECVLSLLQNTEAIIQNLSRILHSGGKLIISDIVHKNSAFTNINNDLSIKNKANINDIPHNAILATKYIKYSPFDAVLNTKKEKTSCANGALNLKQVKNILCQMGFKIIVEKNYTKALAELAALLVLHDLQLSDYFLPNNKSCACKQNKDLAYVLLVAEKI